jgi:hypothetical protein
VVIRAVDTASGKRPFEPSEYRFVPDVHAKSHMRLATVAAKMTFANQEADKESQFELCRHWRSPLFHRHVTRETFDSGIMSK